MDMIERVARADREDRAFGSLGIEVPNTEENLLAIEDICRRIEALIDRCPKETGGRVRCPPHR